MSEESMITRHRLPERGIRPGPDDGFVKLWEEIEQDPDADPVLLLCIEPDGAWRPGPDIDVQPFTHQTAGVGCRHPEVVAVRLPWRPDALTAAKTLGADWFESNQGAWGQPLLTQAVRYAADLDRLFGDTVGCNIRYPLLQEAWYPIDATAAALAVLTDADLPDRLDGLLEFDSRLDEVSGLWRWSVIIAGPNSD